MLLLKLGSVDSQNASPTIMRSYTAVLPIKELIHSKKSAATYPSCYVPSHPEASSLVEGWNGLLKTQLHGQPADSLLGGQGRVLKKAVRALNQHLVP